MKANWSLSVCEGCHGIIGLARGLAAACTCDPANAKRGHTVVVVPAQQEGGVEEALNQKQIALAVMNVEAAIGAREIQTTQDDEALLDRLIFLRDGTCPNCNGHGRAGGNCPICSRQPTTALPVPAEQEGDYLDEAVEAALDAQGCGEGEKERLRADDRLVIEAAAPVIEKGVREKLRARLQAEVDKRRGFKAEVENPAAAELWEDYAVVVENAMTAALGFPDLHAAPTQQEQPRCGEEGDDEDLQISEEELAERRKDPAFRARLERSIEENRELLERLGAPPAPTQQTDPDCQPEHVREGGWPKKFWRGHGEVWREGDPADALPEGIPVPSGIEVVELVPAPEPTSGGEER